MADALQQRQGWRVVLDEAEAWGGYQAQWRPDADAHAVPCKSRTHSAAQNLQPHQAAGNTTYFNMPSWLNKTWSCMND